MNKISYFHPKYLARSQSKFLWGFTEINPNLMGRFILTDTASVELFFNIFTSGIKITVIPWDQLLYPCIVKVCCLGLEHLWPSSPSLCHFKTAHALRTGISWGVRKDRNHWTQGPGYRVNDWKSPSRTSAGDVLTVEPFVATDLAQLTNFDGAIQKLYHRPHFAVGGCWSKTFHFQPLQRCYCENSGRPARTCIIRRHYSITYTQSLHAMDGLLAVGTYFVNTFRIIFLYKLCFLESRPDDKIIGITVTEKQSECFRATAVWSHVMRRVDQPRPRPTAVCGRLWMTLYLTYFYS